MPDRDVVIRIRAQNLSKAEIDKARRQLDGLAKKAGSASKKFGPLSKGVSGLSQNFAQMNPAASTASRLFVGLGPAGLAAAAGVAALGGAIGLGVRNVIALGDQLTTLAAKTSLSTDFLQKLQFVALKLDVPFETTAKAVSKLQVNLGKLTPTKESLDALQQLGLNIGEIKKLDAEAQFLAVGDAIKALKSPTEQAAAAAALFGRAGIELLPALRDNYKEVLEEAEALGLVLSEDLLVAGDELGENWETLTRVGGSLLSEAVGPLVSGLNDVAIATLENKNKVGEWVDAYIKSNPIIQANILLLEGWAAVLGIGTEKAKEAEEGLESLTKARALQAELFARMNEGAVEFAKEEEKRAKAAKLAAKEAEKQAIAAGKQALATIKQTLADRALDDQLKELAATLTSTNPLITEQEIAMDRARAGAIGWSESLEEAEERFASMSGGDFGESVIVPLRLAEDEAIDFSDAIADLAHTFQILGIDANSTLGSMIANFSTLAVQIPKLKEEFKKGGVFGVGGAIGEGDEVGAALGVAAGIGAIATSTSSGSTGARTGKGALAGASAGAQVGGPIGAIVGAAAGAITGFLRGRGAAKALDSIQNEVGLRVSEGLLDAIRDSGRPAQLMIAEIFSEGIAAGTASADDLAREMGDVFSFLQRGEITEFEASTALEQSVPLLLQNLQELGPAGQAELERIIGAAKSMNIEFQGLQELIGSTFATQTLEEMKVSLGLTGVEVRALAETLQVDLETNLERAARAAGLTVAEFKSLQTAAGEALNLEVPASMTELSSLMAATGLSAAELAERLGLDVAVGAESAADAQAMANTRLEEGAFLAERLRDALEGAARASGGIGLGGGGLPVESFAHGGDRLFTRPTLALFGEAGPERVSFQPVGGGGGTKRIEIDVNVHGNAMSGAAQLALSDAIREEIRNGVLTQSDLDRAR